MQRQVYAWDPAIKAYRHMYVDLGRAEGPERRDGGPAKRGATAIVTTNPSGMGSQPGGFKRQVQT